MATVFIFGNPDLPIDALPLRLLDGLKKLFPDTQFEIKDPNEEWEVPEELTIIDTVLNIPEIKVFSDLEKFKTSPRITMHGFDALMNLQYLQKLGKLKKIKIIGIPPTISEKEVLAQIRGMLP